jgi:hypothetical protein
MDTSNMEQSTDKFTQNEVLPEIKDKSPSGMSVLALMPAHFHSNEVPVIHSWCSLSEESRTQLEGSREAAN